jgi:hypothetical protein
LDHWSNLLASFEDESQTSVRYLTAQLLETELPLRTRSRIQLLLDALPSQEKAVGTLLRAAGVKSIAEAATPRSDREADGMIPDSLLSYFTLIHRDYSWAPLVDEVEQSITDLLQILPSDFRLGRTLVIGAGTGRLAWELGLRLGESAPIVALDINPLPLLVTAQLLSGATLKLFELPGHPLRSNFAAIERQLKAPEAVPPGLQLLFADGLTPPVAGGQWDTVITPWFLDQVPKNLATFVPVLRDLLVQGGSWLQTGPFVYNPARTKPAHRYPGDEFLKIVGTAGFRVEKATYESVSYLASPISSQSRREYVLNLHAKKISHSSPSVQLPAWLKEEGVELPVPLFAQLQGFQGPHPMVTTVAHLIDGQRSCRSIAFELIESGRLEID